MHLNLQLRGITEELLRQSLEISYLTNDKHYTYYR